MKLTDLTENQINIYKNILKKIKQQLSDKNNRLSEAYKNKDITFQQIFEAIKMQKCLRVKNHVPDKHNEHLEYISLGPSYIEGQINKIIKKIDMPKSTLHILQKQIGLNH